MPANKIGGKGGKPAGVVGGGRTKQSLGNRGSTLRKGKHPGQKAGKRRVGG